MRASHFFTKLIFGVFFMPAFVLSSDLTTVESDLDMNEVQTLEDFDRSAFHARPDDLLHCSKKREGAIFASYRNNTDQRILGGGNVLFNVKNSNKGNGIRYDSNTGVFTIQKAGFYLVNYGLASIGKAGTPGSAFGFNLIKTRNGQQTIVDSVLADASSAIILFLAKDDTLSVVAQFTVKLVAGSLPPKTTSFTDTSFISLLKVER